MIFSDFLFCYFRFWPWPAGRAACPAKNLSGKLIQPGVPNAAVVPPPASYMNLPLNACMSMSFADTVIFAADTTMTAVRHLTMPLKINAVPTGAIKRTFIEDPYFEYRIDERLCNGCGKCVKGCGDFGNGSMILQVRHNRCLNCHECAIAKVCPGDAFRRVPISTPYLLKEHH